MANELNNTLTQSAIKSIDINIQNSFYHSFIYLYKKFPFLAYSVFGYTYAQILGAILLFLFIFLARPLLIRFIIFLALKLSKKTKTHYDDLIIKNLYKPLRFSFLILGFYLLSLIFYLNYPWLNRLFFTLIIYNIFWILFVIINSLSPVIKKTLFKLNPDIANELSLFVIRLVKIVLWIIGLSIILSLWGINVTALIASLGIGGLAFALAAKDAAANLFGSIALVLDKTIKIGDWVKVAGVEGIVEEIGMRTTKIRTFEKALVSIPNSIVANSQIENFSRRNKRRIKLSLGLVYNTSNEQMQKIVQEIRQMLLAHPNIAKDETLLVNFDNFGDSAKEIFIYTFTNTANWQKYLAIKEDIFYKIAQIVQKHGSDFAFPSQSVYIESLPKAKAKGN